MAVAIPETHKDLVEGPVYVTLATLMPDGQLQLSVIWCNYDGTHVLVNTARGRQKEKNMRKRPQVAILAIDPQDPYRYLEVRGLVDELVEEGAKEHIEQLSRLYMNKPFYGGTVPAERENKEVRVICKIRPTCVRVVG